MRVMLDTNIIVSAVLFPKSNLVEAIWKITNSYNLVICSYMVEELQRVFKKKFPNRLEALEEFLTKLSYEYFYTPKIIDKSKFPKIRDNADLPILVSSILADIDIFVTGDKDFSEIEIEKPEILTPKEFIEKY